MPGGGIEENVLGFIKLDYVRQCVLLPFRFFTLHVYDLKYCLLSNLISNFPTKLVFYDIWSNRAAVSRDGGGSVPHGPSYAPTHTVPYPPIKHCHSLYIYVHKTTHIKMHLLKHLNWVKCSAGYLVIRCSSISNS